jgi:hypothetical protein
MPDPTKKPEPPLRQHPDWVTMHDHVDECTDDICCCEPEPRWQQLAEELQRTTPAALPPSAVPPPRTFNL